MHRISKPISLPLSSSSIAPAHTLNDANDVSSIITLVIVDINAVDIMVYTPCYYYWYNITINTQNA